jgi:phospho-N-acetylmuramoyl-pentapeptide-transferase
VSQPQEFVKIIIYTVVAFISALVWAPSLIRLLRWLRFWKKTSRSVNMSGESFENKSLEKFYIHDESKMKIPRGGGIVIWVTAFAIALIFWILLKIEPDNKTFQYLNFINRKQTFIPLGTLFFGAILGLVDDALSTLESGGNYLAGGLKLSQRLITLLGFSFLIGLWFFARLDITYINFFNFHIDFNNFLNTGLDGRWLIIPFTMFVLTLLWGSSVIDGFDGLTGGVMVPIYLCFSGIAYIRGFFDIAVLMGVIGGATLAFLWFNISPAKFYMGDTGSTPLLLTLGVVAILINATYLLPIAGITLLATVSSNIIQIFSKKVLKRKVFLAAPLHHHFEAIGLKRDQIVLRYWIVTIAMCGLSLALAMLIK